MSLHTREQAPREGEKHGRDEEGTGAGGAMDPDGGGIFEFLVRSRRVRRHGRSSPRRERAEYGAFMNNGLERSEALRKDIAYVMERFDLPPREASGPGKEYAELLTALAKECAEFICHYYNVYFAHSRGANDREKSERDDLGWERARVL